MRRGFLARYTEFDWGPPASTMPYLPRVRYGRAVLSPATWNITPHDEAAKRADLGSWETTFQRWRQRWNCPDVVELHDGHRSLRLDLTTPAHLTVLRDHLNERGQARLTETETATDTAWIGGHCHEIVMPFTRDTPATPSRITGSWPLVTNADVAHRPAAPKAGWLQAQVFTHPERLDDIIGVHLPQLLATADDPAYWFARYRSTRENTHLRLRLRVRSPGHYAAMAMKVGRWGEELCAIGAASRITLATYHPELGRYGSGAAMDAAEEVFAADSHAVALALRLLPPRVIHPIALTAISMVEIAEGFHASPDEAATWLLDHLITKADASAERPIVAHTELWARNRTLPDGGNVPTRLNATWTARHAALRRYRGALPPDADTDQILSALLHMHHNRARLIDRTDETICMRLARRIALTRRAQRAREQE